MKFKRILSLLLALAMAAALALPVGAAGSSFRDVTDPETAVHADVLRLMGVVDGTGDADVAAMCGVPTYLHEDKNPLAAWYYYLDEGKLRLNQLGLCDVRDDQTRSQTLASDTRITGVDAWENSRFMLSAHSAILADVNRRRERSADLVPVTIATIPQLRMTRRIQAAVTASCSVPAETVADSVGLYSDWTKRGPVYALPFGTMYHESVKNLLVAGRCLAADHDMWNITRVIPVCVVSGQAAGTAFALADRWDQVDIAALQDQLRRDGVRIQTDEIEG